MLWKEILIGEGICVKGVVYWLGCLRPQVTESLDSRRLEQQGDISHITGRQRQSRLQA